MTPQQPDDVWIIEQNVWGKVLKRGAFMSLVSYLEGGIEYNVYIENSEFIERDVKE